MAKKKTQLMTNNPSQNSFKKHTKKTKKYPFRNLILELKRVRWPSRNFAANSYYKVIIFILIFVVIFFIITFLTTYLWSYLGVGFSAGTGTTT